MKIRLEKTFEGFDVIFDTNSRKLGTFEMQINGEWLFFISNDTGGWSVQALNMISKELQRINEKYGIE